MKVKRCIPAFEAASPAAANNQAGHLRDNIRTKAGYDLAKALIAADFGAAVAYIAASAASLSALAAR